MKPIRPTRPLTGSIVVEAMPVRVGSNVYRGVDLGVTVEPVANPTAQTRAAPYRIAPPVLPANRPIAVIVRQRNVSYSSFKAATLARHRMSETPAPRLLQALALGDRVVASVEEYLRGVTLEGVLQQLRARGEHMPVPIALAIAHGLVPLWIAATSARPLIRLVANPAAVMLDATGNVRALPDYARELEQQTIVEDGDDLERVVSGPPTFGLPRHPYAPPEESYGAKSPDVRGGMFTLGLLLYEMIAGTHPIASGESTGSENLSRMARHDVPPLAQRRVDLPTVVTDFVHRCLARYPEHRFASWRELDRALVAVQALYPVTGPADIADYLRTELGIAVACEIELDVEPNAWRDYPSPGYHAVSLPAASREDADTA